MKGSRRALMPRLEGKKARQRDPGERVRALPIGSKTLSRLLLSLGAALLVATGILALSQPQPEPGQTFHPEAILTAHNSEQRSTPAAASGPSNTPVRIAPITRLRIPTIEVDAAVVVKGLDENGAMETPDGPWDVAWYDFSARPGTGSNVVFSGHVDHQAVGPAVFWDLSKLQPDSVVEVHLEDGAVYRYRVIAKDTVDVATAPVAQIVGPTPTDSVTLITCAGRFDRTTQTYDQRLVVRAERVHD